MKRTTIAERLLEHFAQGGEVSIYNMKKVWITNPAREVARNFENIHNIELERKRVNKPTGGTYCVYSVKPKDIPRVKELYLKSLSK